MFFTSIALLLLVIAVSSSRTRITLNDKSRKTVKDNTQRSRSSQINKVLTGINNNKNNVSKYVKNGKKDDVIKTNSLSVNIPMILSFIALVPFIYLSIIMKENEYNVWFMLSITAFSLIKQISLLYHYFTVPLHPKFLMLRENWISVIAHILSGTIETIASIIGIIALYFFPFSDVALDIPWGQIQALAAVFYSITTAFQSRLLLGAKAIMIPSYALLITLHLLYGVYSFMTPHSHLTLLKTYITYSTFTIAKFYVTLLRSNNLAQGHEYTLSIILACLSTLPFILGPSATFLFIITYAVYFEIIKYVNKVNSNHSDFKLLFQENSASNNNSYMSDEISLWKYKKSNLHRCHIKDFAKVLFKQFDIDQNKQLNKNEIMMMIKECSFNTSIINTLVKAIKKSKINEIDFSVFYYCLLQHKTTVNGVHLSYSLQHLCRTNEEKSKFVFDIIDSDKNNTIDRKELLTILMKYGISEYQVNQYFTTCDYNKDGKISYEEFHYRMSIIWKFIVNEYINNENVSIQKNIEYFTNSMFKKATIYIDNKPITTTAVSNSKVSLHYSKTSSSSSSSTATAYTASMKTTISTMIPFLVTLCSLSPFIYLLTVIKTQDYHIFSMIGMAIIYTCSHFYNIFDYLSYPLHPKFQIVTQQYLARFIRNISSSIELITSIVGFILLYKFPESSIAINIPWGKIQLISALFHATTFNDQIKHILVPNTTSTKGLILPCIYLNVILHIIYAIKSYLNPFCYLSILKTYLLFNSFTISKFYEWLLKRNKLLSGYELTISTYLSLLTVLPFIMGPCSNFLIMIVFGIYLSLIQYYNSIYSHHSQFLELFIKTTTTNNPTTNNDDDLHSIMSYNNINKWKNENVPRHIPKTYIQDQLNRKFITRRIFHQLDTNRDGKLNNKEFLPMNHMITLLMNKIQVSKEQSINYKQFHELLQYVSILMESSYSLQHLCRTNEEKSKFVFDIIDSDKNNTIDRKELLTILMKYGISEYQVNQYFTTCDYNKDGKISYEEFHYRMSIIWKFIVNEYINNENHVIKKNIDLLYKK